MHPHTYYSTLFDHEKRDEVFVVMSFAAGFQHRWTDVLEPWIREDLGMRAVRVDENESGESVVHDILDGIAHARLILVDITAITMTDLRGEQWPQRNANVMWELGLAHVMRLPDEVVVVKSDAEKTPFDLTQFRAFQYDPSAPTEARRLLTKLAKDRLRSVEQSRAAHVGRAAASLDYMAFELLLTAEIGGLHPQRPKTRGDQLSWATKAHALNRLLELGLVRTRFPRVTLEEAKRTERDDPAGIMQYEITAFGHAVMLACNEQMFGREIDPALAEYMRAQRPVKPE